MKLLAIFAFCLHLYNSTAYLSNMKELTRQYLDYKKVFNKPDTINGFQLFVQNLNKIEEYNKNNPRCKMFLNRYSDTEDPNFGFNTCSI